ncbi:efflux transporter outer membrane subunit [Novosphingobium sp. 1949]|uniref:Efflux transporter outer membrane subunit n=1 Tax=Novosphingobium organovorum TaxID=2930092 RepID=A0ABT0BHU9_9SPHN|nr:efflux transporter outer membrane subunit [Novosphingobium organovorum]MCJ2184428.1 efflux transporter outer membrane subunit [Novosphingobium organovorum]
MAASISLAACAPDLGPRAQVRPPASFESATTIPASASDARWPEQRWWTAYGDPQLDALVDEALKGSPDLASAVARIEQARGALQTSRSALLPTLGAQGSGEVAKQSYNNGTPASALPKGWKDYGTLALSGSWSLDIWGKNRALLAAATSATQAAVAELRQSQLVLSSEVVSSYFDLARLIERQAILEEALKTRSGTADLNAKRFAQGLDTESPLRQARAEVARARLDLAANAEQIALRRHALAALLGAGPDRTATLTPRPIAAIAETPVPANAGIGLAGRRPDVVAARALVEASAKGEDYARKSFLPDISLSGLLGVTSLGIANLFDSGSDYGNAGAAISLPIFQGGALSGKYRMARGGYDSMVASYNSTVIDALQDVADAISSRTSAVAQEAHAHEAEQEAQAAYTLADQRYQAGLSTYLTVLSTQDTELDARLSALDAHFATLASEVALTRALGGGYADETKEKATTDE